jgi:AcrR family transcriptional regulator
LVSDAEIPSPPSPWTEGKAHRGRGRDFPVKREAVVSAAAALMGRKGYGGASLADLAEILGVTKPTLYHYVGSKEQLFAEIVGRSQAATIAFIGGVAAGPGTGLAKLRAIMLGYMKIVNSDAGTCLLFASTADIGAEAQRQIRARAKQANALIYEVLAEGQADGTLRIPDRTVALNTLFGSLNWTPNWYRPGQRLALDEIAAQQVDLLLNGVRA